MRVDTVHAVGTIAFRIGGQLAEPVPVGTVFVLIGKLTLQFLALDGNHIPTEILRIMRVDTSLQAMFVYIRTGFSFVNKPI